MLDSQPWRFHGCSMSQPSVTDWMQAIGSIAALGLSGISLVWQWRTARKAKGNRLTCEATRFGPEIWRMVVSFEADHRSSPPKLVLKVRNPRPETALASSSLVRHRTNEAGIAITDVGLVLDLKPTRKLTVEMAFDPAPSRQATVTVFVRNPVEDEPMKVSLEVKTGGIFPAAKRTVSVIPLA